MNKIALFVLLLLPSLASAMAPARQVQIPSSYDAVRKRVYAEPLNELPEYSGFDPGSFIQAFLGLGGRLVDRVQGTLTRSEDFVAQPMPKLFHPMGVCAEAVWEIYGDSEYSGLFERGTYARALVRMSAVDKQVTYSQTKPRTFGLALKLFPAKNRAEAMVTRNLQMIDLNGLDGGLRNRFMVSDHPSAPVYFRNIATGKGTAAELGGALFKRFDPHPELRPLYPFSEVTARGETVPADRVKTPYEIRLFPRVSHPARTETTDFREELLSYGYREMWFEIAVVQPDKSVERIGTLELQNPVVSVACDQALHFHHHPNR